MSPVRILVCLLLGGVVMAADGLQLSPAERDWIARHPVVRIQMSDVSPPFEFRADGRWQGLAYDSLLAACRRLGLQVQVTGMPWAQALEGIGAGDGVDLLLAVTSSPERARQMLLTRPYLAFPQVIIADRHHAFISGLPDLRNATIAVEREYVMEGWLRRDLPDARLLLVGDSLPALAAVATRRADAYLGNLAVASYLIERHGLVNLGVAAPSGYGDEEFAMGVRKDWPELVALLDRAFAEMPPEERQAIRQQWLSVRYEHGLRYTDIVLWVLAVSGVLLVFIVQLRRMVRHRTAELAREVALRREREIHLAEAQRIAHLGSWTRDLSGGGIVWSDEIRRIFGWPAGRPATAIEHLDVIHPEDRGRLAGHLADVVAGRQPDDLEFRITRPNGEIRHLIQRCHLLDGGEAGLRRVQGIVQDITVRKLAEDERVRLERSLQHAEKLRVLGQLAGGIAHDFNNMLGGITGHAELLQLAVADGQALPAERVRRHAGGIIAAAERAAAITAQLRVHARRDGMDAAPVDVHSLISETAELVRRGAGPGITVRLDLQSPASIVEGEAALIQTALANLALNARDAMSGGGVLSITTGQLHLTGDLASGRSFGIRPGRHLVITVTDSGAGMDAAVQARLFEPFFTTKEHGKGTGLGLANVLACVRTHRGGIEVDSRPGHGTTFRLYLPLAEISRVPARTQEAVRGQGRILLVDDDPMLRDVTSEMLRTLGYTVTVAEDGARAEAIFAQEPRFDLVIADMLMPGMDGRTLINRLRAIDPQARILIASGAYEDGPAHPIAEADGFLEKPFDLVRLAQRVAETLRAVKSD